MSIFSLKKNQPGKMAAFIYKVKLNVVNLRGFDVGEGFTPSREKGDPCREGINPSPTHMA